MHGIKNIVIIGAGAMGILYASQFSQNNNFNVYLGVYGERYSKLKDKEILFNDTPYIFNTIDLDKDTIEADLIIISVKYHNLKDIIPKLNRIISKKTIIISILNGLDSENEIGSVYGMDKILYTTTVGMDAVRDKNVITCKNLGKLVFGELKNHILSDKVKRLKNLLDIAGINYDIPEEMEKAMWWKFMVNVGMNQTSAVLGASYGDFQKSKHIRDVMEGLMREVILLSSYEGVNLDYQNDLKVKWYEVLYKLDPKGKTSMLQDIEAKRKTEVEIFSGKVLTLSKKYNIDLKYNKVVYEMIKGMEDTYLDGANNAS